ncbi:hypothetical protein M514_09451 [Trichuris suis]|uniref:Uncharacterized protein n=1 Tax=Trichuris suis TaxID=68888 RepID=A0A085LXC3_9BILA|nr:hypothetical protein M513_09451 [Trichuris suis]KFD66267.1 hypothetical protein M514_09451 [Trichuris suis]
MSCLKDSCLYNSTVYDNAVPKRNSIPTNRTIESSCPPSSHVPFLADTSVSQVRLRHLHPGAHRFSPWTGTLGARTCRSGVGGALPACDGTESRPRCTL